MASKGEGKNKPVHIFNYSAGSAATNQSDTFFRDPAISNLDEWEKGLYKQQLNAIDYYTGSGYIKMNDELFSIENFDDMSTSTKQHAYQLQKALNMFELNHPVQMTRGVPLEHLGVSSIAELKALAGQTRVFDGFLSTSAANTPPSMWKNSKVWLKINVPPGKGVGAYVGKSYGLSSETEFIVNAGSVMKFGEPKLVNGHWEVTAEYIGRQSKIPTVGKGKKK